MQIITRPALFISAILFTLMYSVSASAYIFGPPPVTELAESGENLDNISLFKREESFIDTLGGSTATKYQSTGLAGVIKKGDRTGATNFMYRLSKTTVPTVSSFDGTDFGFGIGGEWNMLSDRSLGILANLQMDYGRISAGTTFPYNRTSTVWGGEVGAVYRVFVDQATVAPFIMYNVYQSSTYHDWTSSLYSDYYIYRNGTSINLGVSVIIGKFNITYTQTSSTYKYSFDTSSSTGTVNSDGNMLTIGFNY